MHEEFFDKLEELRKKNEPFVTATVVRREVPSSGKSGDKAIIDKFGRMTGWIGGGCVKGIILKEADDAIKSGRSRLVKVGKSLSTLKQEGVVDYKMTCMSEGTVEVFIEPVLPSPHLVVIGKTAIAKALVKIARTAGFRITVVANDITPQTFEKVDELITQISLEPVKLASSSSIVVCTQGDQDEDQAGERQEGSDGEAHGPRCRQERGITQAREDRDEGRAREPVCGFQERRRRPHAGADAEPVPAPQSSACDHLATRRRRR